MPPKEKLEPIEVYLVEDGIAEVFNLESEERYQTTLTTCTCPDFEKRGGSYTVGEDNRRCKHQIAVAHRTPCSNCHRLGGMILDEEHWIFECPNCGWTKDVALVGEERQEAKRKAERQKKAA